MSSVNWTSCTAPESLVNVGMDALAMWSDNIVYVFDLKKSTTFYHKADSPTVGAGISCLQGHNRFPMFAYVESMLRPSIFVIKYPEMSKYAVFKTETVMSYTDIRFSEHDHLVAITGYPLYTLRIWNYRTQQLLTEINTYRKAMKSSLRCSNNTVPQIMQVCQWQLEIVIWELCFAAESTQFHEVSTVQLDKGHSESIVCGTAYWDDGNVYVVNDYGVLSKLDTSQFYLKRQWAPHILNKALAKPRRHCLAPHKTGLVINNADVVYSVRHKSIGWTLEWTYDNTVAQVLKFRSNFTNDIFAVDALGNLYRIEPIENVGTLLDVQVNRCIIVEFAILKGIKEEAFLVLTNMSELRLLEALRMIVYSKLEFIMVNALTVHNTQPYAAIVTGDAVQMVSYERPRAPELRARFKFGDFKLISLRWQDTCIVGEEYSTGRLRILYANCKQDKIYMISSLPNWVDVLLLQYFLYDEIHLLAFIDRIEKENPKENDTEAATELWTNELIAFEYTVQRTEIVLPFKCRSASVINGLSAKDVLEIFAVRDCDYIIDMYTLIEHKELRMIGSIHTNHFGFVTGISGLRNILSWGVDGIIYHFRSHKRSSKAYVISRSLQQNFSPRFVKRAEECFNSKYLATLDIKGCLTCFRLPTLNDNLRENRFILVDADQVITMGDPYIIKTEQQKQQILIEVTPEERELRNRLDEDLRAIAIDVQNLINYDMNVTGRSHGIFRKFCLNVKWLRILNEEARILFDMERKFLEESISDQTRIRDWIMKLISNTTALFSTKLRSLFSNTILESYAISKPIPAYIQQFDVYRFYDLEPIDDDNASDDGKDVNEEGDKNENNKVNKKPRKRYVIQGKVFDHVMTEEFYVQEKDNVTANQMHYDSICFKMILKTALKVEFNKIFNEVRQFKAEIIEQILTTNSVLNRIYDNMNCMLRLLKMDQFEPPMLSFPEWALDEIIEKILTVDDSEIKAINRRKKIQLVTAHKSGRMLLWAIEFWVNALNTMMDGVLEKLWEEEIKKTPPPPEFALKKQQHEFTLEEVKLYREYQDKLELLEKDRHKYLRILNENEKKTLQAKTSIILKMNERCAEIAILKLKYDFAIGHGRLRLLSSKMKQFIRMKSRKRVSELRNDIDKMIEYIMKYGKLADFWEKATIDNKMKLENLTMRDKTIEKEFKAKYLNTIPSHLVHEMNKLFKKRPKIAPKSFNSNLVCMEVAARITQRSQRAEFPLANEVIEYIKALDALDDLKNSPNQLEAKNWDNFVKIRRQKVESELKIKGLGYQLLDAQNGMNSFIKDIAGLKSTKSNANVHLDEMGEEYFNSVQDQAIQLTLTMGQVEVCIAGVASNLKSSILMHIDDINDVNEMIKKAGSLKLKAMHRVAFFRRQVIFKEWEHQVVRANIDYLKYILNVIEKCKVSMEFLQILRNWDRVKENRKSVTSAGLIDRVILNKLTASRKNLDRTIEKIENVKVQIEQMKRQNQQVNRQINDVKVAVVFATVNRDTLAEKKRIREQKERMAKINIHRALIDTVRRDYAHILELNTILELQRLRTYPTLRQAPPQCS